MVAGAPVIFFGLLLVIGIVMYFAMSWSFGHQISTRDGQLLIHEERHKLKDEKIASFLSRTEGSASPEMKAEIGMLRTELRGIHRNQQRTITREQRRIIYESLRPLSAEEKTDISIAVHPYDSEAGRYALEFQRLFLSLGLGGGMTNPDIPPNVSGLLIRIGGERPQPSIVGRLSRALTRAGLKHEIRSLALKFPVQAGSCELVVGRCAPECVDSLL